MPASLFSSPKKIVPAFTLLGSVRVKLPFDPKFLQAMVDQLIIGEHRHGKNDAIMDYLKRGKEEIRRFEETGNIDHLVAAANYMLLEAHYPLHPGVHYSATDSNGRNVHKGE